MISLLIFLFWACSVIVTALSCVFDDYDWTEYFIIMTLIITAALIYSVHLDSKVLS